MELRILKLNCGMDVIDDLSAYSNTDFLGDDLVNISGLYLPKVIILKNPRVILLQHVPSGVNLSLMPYNFADSSSEESSVELFRDSLVSVSKVSVLSDLNKSYLKSVSSLALA